MNHPLRLRHISVSGFKSLDNFHCHFQPNMSVLIGSNGTGKSTLLQFFSLIKAFLSGEPKHFFEDRGWLPERVNFNATPLIETSLTFETAEKAQILWTFQWNMKQQINQHETLQYQQCKHANKPQDLEAIGCFYNRYRLYRPMSAESLEIF
jgi:predicted ATPase